MARTAKPSATTVAASDKRAKRATKPKAAKGTGKAAKAPPAVRVPHPYVRKPHKTPSFVMHGAGKIATISLNGKVVFDNVSFTEKLSMGPRAITVDGHVILKMKASDKVDWSWVVSKNQKGASKK